MKHFRVIFDENLKQKANKDLKEKLDRYTRDYVRFSSLLELDEKNIGIDGSTPINLSRDFFQDKERNNLILVLAQKRNAWKFIDKVYQENKYEYHKAYTETFFATSIIKNAYSLETKEYINKLAGIDAWCRLNNTEEPMLKIIQKLYNKIYSQFKSGIKTFNVDKQVYSNIQLNEKMNKKNQSNSNNLVEIAQSVEIIIVSKYLAGVFDVEIDGFLWKNYMEGYLDMVFFGVDAMLDSYATDEEITDEVLDKACGKIFDISFKEIKKCHNLDEFVKLISNNQVTKVQKTASIMGNPFADLSDASKDALIMEKLSEKALENNNVLTKDNISEVLASMTADSVKTFGPTDIYKETMSLVWLFKINGLEEDVMQSLPINRHIISTAITTMSEKYNLLKFKDLEKFNPTQEERIRVMSLITIFSLLEKYKTQTPSVFSKESESVMLELDTLNAKIKEKDERIKILEQKILEMENSNKLRVNDVLAELNLKNSKIEKLEKELSLAKSNEKEFNAIKELVYRNSVSGNEIAIAIEEETITIEDKTDYLNNKKIMVLGGHPNWVNKLKRRLPNARYIDVEGYASQKFTRLDKYDLLVICTNYIDHGLIYKLGEAIKNVESKKVVMVDNINTDIVLDEIYTSAIEYEENNGF
jgi:hypothetical protein